MRSKRSRLSERKAQCMYCLELKRVSLFNREHVIHRSMTGNFQPINLTLINTVCKECNQAFGDTVDAAIGRGYAEGFSRFQNEMKDPSKIAELSTDNLEFDVEDKVAFEREVGEFSDTATDHLRLEFGDGSIVRLTRKQLAARPLESHIDLNQVVAFRIWAATDETNDEIASLCESQLAAAGFEINRVFKNPLTVRATYGITAFRAFAKIAFNYLAKISESTPEVALSKPFDLIRNFVRYCHEPPREYVQLVNQDVAVKFDGKQLRGHWITIYVKDERLIVELSLFNRHQWRITLCQNIHTVGLPSDLGSTHVWDFRTMRCEKIDQSRLSGLPEKGG